MSAHLMLPGESASNVRCLARAFDGMRASSSALKSSVDFAIKPMLSKKELNLKIPSIGIEPIVGLIA